MVKGITIDQGGKSCHSESWRLILKSREGVMVIGQKKNQKVELPELEELRHRVKEIKKRKEKMYKRFTKQSKKRR